MRTWPGSEGSSNPSEPFFIHMPSHIYNAPVTLHSCLFSRDEPAVNWTC